MKVTANILGFTKEEVQDMLCYYGKEEKLSGNL